MSKQDTIISLLREIDKNIDNVGSGGNIPKIKVSIFKVTNECIDENGYWAGELLDTSEMTNFEQLFMKCTNLQNIDVSNWNTENVLYMTYAFRETGIIKLDLSNWNTNNTIIFRAMFFACYSLEWLNLVGTSARSVTSSYNINAIFDGCIKLKTIVGDYSIEDVISKNLSCFDGLSVAGNMTLPTSIDRASLRAVINGLADLTGQTAQTLTFGATLIAKLTEEDIAIATAKNWTIA